MKNWPITFSLPQGFSVGGLTSWVLRMTDALLERGRRVTWVVHPSYAGFDELPESSLPHHEMFRLIRSTSMLEPGNWTDWVKCYRETLPTILLPAVLAESYAVAAALATVHADDLRVIAWNHSDNPYDYAYLSRYEPLVHRYVVNTSACDCSLRQQVRTRGADIAFIPHGVSLCASVAREANASRPIRVAYGGRFDQLVKRVLEFPALALRLHAMGVRFDMKLVGDGPLRTQLEQAASNAARTIRASGSTLCIEPARMPSEMPQLWQWADVAMLMSAHEGLSVAMLEAMAAGCVPVVTQVASGAGDVIRTGRNGMVFPIGDVDRAARCITELAKDPTLRANLAGEARETIASNYSFKTHVDQFLSLVGQVESSKPRAWPATLPVLANGPSEFGSGAALTVPSDAATRLTRLLARISEEDGGPVLIYGAGRHTRALAEIWASSPVEISAVIDDDPGRHGESLWGWPILGLDDVGGLDANSVVISSWMHENAMWLQRHAFERLEMKVFRLYGEGTCALAPLPARLA